MDSEIINCCRLWDDYVGLGELSEPNIGPTRENLVKAINGHGVIEETDFKTWNRWAIFEALSKRKKIENPDFALMLSVFRNGKTERYYKELYGKQDLTQFTNLMKDTCKSLGLTVKKE